MITLSHEQVGNETRKLGREFGLTTAFKETFTPRLIINYQSIFLVGTSVEDSLLRNTDTYYANSIFVLFKNQNFLQILATKGAHTAQREKMSNNSTAIMHLMHFVIASIFFVFNSLINIT